LPTKLPATQNWLLSSREICQKKPGARTPGSQEVRADLKVGRAVALI